MTEKNLELLAMAIRVGLSVLGERLMVVLPIMLFAGMFGWSMYQGTWESLATAVLYAMANLVLLSAMRSASGRHENPPAD